MEISFCSYPACNEVTHMQLCIGETTVLWWHVQNFVVVWNHAMELHWNTGIVSFNLAWFFKCFVCVCVAFSHGEMGVICYSKIGDGFTLKMPNQIIYSTDKMQICHYGYIVCKLNLIKCHENSLEELAECSETPLMLQYWKPCPVNHFPQHASAWHIYLDLYTLTFHWPGPRFDIKMSSHQYSKSHCGDKTVVRSSYLHNGISYTGKMASFYWISPLVIFLFRMNVWSLVCSLKPLTSTKMAILYLAIVKLVMYNSYWVSSVDAYGLVL